MGWHATPRHARSRALPLPVLLSESHPPSLRTCPEVSPRAPKSSSPRQRIQKQRPQSGAPPNGGYEFKGLPARSGVGTDKRARGTGQGRRPGLGSSPVPAALLHHTDWGEESRAARGRRRAGPDRPPESGQSGTRPGPSPSQPAGGPARPGTGVREGVSIVPGAGAWLPNKGPAPPPRPALPRPRGVPRQGEEQGAPAGPGSRGKPGVSASARGEGKGR